MSEWLTAVGWALIHSLWQGAFIFALLVIVLKLFRNVLTSSGRYLLYVAGVGALLIWSTLTLAGHMSSVPTETTTHDFVFGPALHVGLSLDQSWTAWFENHVGVVVLVWMVGIVAQLFRLGAGIFGVYQLRNSAQPLTHLSEPMDRLRTFYGIRQVVSIGESIKVKAPMVIGTLKPLILFPLGYATQMPLDQVELVLAHELAHIKRRDYLVHMLMQLVKAIYFFHPMVYWVSRKMEMERECACDDMVLQLQQPEMYARALLSTHDWKISLAMPLGGQNNHLVKRINRIMNRKMEYKQTQPWLIFVLLMVIGTLVWAEKKDLTNPYKLVRSASLYMEPLISPKGPSVSWSIPTMDTVPDLSTRESYRFDPDMDFDEAINLQLDEFIVALQDLEIPEIVEIPPFPDMELDTIIPHEAIRQMQMALEQMEKIEMQELKSMYNSQEFKERIMEHEQMARELEQQVLRNLEELNLEQYESDYLAQIGGLEELHATIEHQMKELEEQLRLLPDMEEEMSRMEEVIREETRHLREFEAGVKEALIEDGYWEEGERLNIKFTNEWMEVNGDRIEGKDYKKYQRLREKYFPQDEDFNYRF